MDSSDDNRKLKLLLVAYDFPPVASAGMPRVVGFAKYLKRAGWDITVLTVDSSFGPTSDASLALVPDGIRVLRTRTFEFRRLWQSAMAKLGEEWAADTGWRPRTGGVRRWTVGVVNFSFRLVDRLFRFPDLKAGWFWPLLWRAWGLLRCEEFNVVLSTSPPHSLQLPLLIVRVLVPFKWVTDWRDPWTIPRRYKKVGVKFFLNRVMERRIMTKCDFVVANTQGNREALDRELGSELAHRVTVITNGLDLELDSPRLEQAVERLDCDIVYMGEVYSGMLDVYVGALRHMRDTSRGPLPKLWVYGQDPRAESVRSVQQFGLGDWVVFKGRVSHVESRAIINRAPALLILVPHRVGHETWVPSKLYSYLFSSAPILALAPQGDVSRIVEWTGRGIVVKEHDPAAVAESIRTFVDANESGKLNLMVDERNVNEFRMEAVAARMGEVLELCVGS